MARESALRQRVGDVLRQAGFFVQAIESITTPGMPDTWYQEIGCTGWLELKKIRGVPALKATSLFTSYNHPISKEQMNWIDLCLSHGGNADILVGYERDYFLIPGEYCRAFNKLTLDELYEYQVKKADIPIWIRKHNRT